ncbi:Uu.00g012120.m01.CDS01 [Anthostomella pinea]|uniref:Uu.00g012120.m01.CDS01 n=1 Tax=Anthostomella pinea TaxID=933095 RepID=A0AAI8VZ47_9PEZI|nr:Uu.00g012120.m01.CDS01 [Anthostomella pinea]
MANYRDVNNPPVEKLSDRIDDFLKTIDKVTTELVPKYNTVAGYAKAFREVLETVEPKFDKWERRLEECRNSGTPNSASLHPRSTSLATSQTKGKNKEPSENSA